MAKEHITTDEQAQAEALEKEQSAQPDPEL